jgi:hypothetical protein
MPNAAQIAAYNFICSEITRLRGPQSHVPLSLDHVTPLADDGNNAVFRVDGARVFVTHSGISRGSCRRRTNPYKQTTYWSV